ncbi:hypothetical protein [Acinetobacter sp. CAAS 2-6]|uniref:hypothetical protein n=1 Tax=Acinetobacter sp. CAAS 2-6 TaxID=3016358 RepID=UPI003FA3B4AD
MMDLLTQISARISKLHSGEKWTISAEDLLLSRADFQSISVYFSRKAQEQGDFSVSTPKSVKPWLGSTSLTIIKH